MQHTLCENPLSYLALLIFQFINLFMLSQCNECGTLGADSRIINGEDTGGVRYPWFALFRLKRTGQPRPYCGGALITPSHVVTAAHCFDVSPELGLEKKDKFTVSLNIYDRCSYDEHGRENYDISEVYVNENFTGYGSFYDIAVAKLDRETSLPTLCLPPPSNDGTTKTEEGLVMGYGYTQEGGPDQPCHLMQTAVKKNSREDCLQTDIPKDTCNTNIVFTGGRDGSGTCQGDDGGPFLTFLDDGRFVLSGIDSYGYGCARPNLPGVYTNMASFIDWIMEVTGASEALSSNETK